MTKEEFKTQLDSVISDYDGDTEQVHIKIDDLMNEALTSMGFDCSPMHDIDMWYA